MIIHLKEHGLYLGVLALKEVQIDDVRAFLQSLSESLGGVEFQVLNLRLVAGLRHILTSVLVALEAFRHGLNIANTVSMEVLVRASAQRQISRALRQLGVKRGCQDLVLVLMDKDRGRVEETVAKLNEMYAGRLDEGLLEADRSSHIMETYGLSDEMVKAEEAYVESLWDAVKNLVAEKVVLTLVA
ncbi:hypothetical protein DRO58_05935 [Candidatus Bathyarchaeota archaeon]|nr:MAG: hypothetical protein DRO58_05935 [Candidatus Bathyarchaeota archaeon]